MNENTYASGEVDVLGIDQVSAELTVNKEGKYA